MNCWIKKTLRVWGGSVFLLAYLLFHTQLTLAQGRPPARVVVSPAIKGHIQDKVTLIGTVEPWRASTVAAEVSGKVDFLKVRRGDKISKEDILAHLGEDDLLFRLEAAKARKNATKIRLEKAKDIQERSEKLKKSEAISSQEYKDARLTVQELEEELAATEIEILNLKDELDKKTVRAPFDGIITRELTEVGQWVQKGGGIMHMIDLSMVRILVDMPEQYVSNLKGNEEIVIKIDALGNKIFKGKIHALIPEGNRDAHIFPLEIHAKNEGLAIKGGMLARVEFNLGLNRSVIMVPKDAIITRGTRSYFFVVDQGKAKQVFVTTGQTKEDLIEVNSSLKEGEMVIIRGNERVRNGQAVQVVSLED